MNLEERAKATLDYGIGPDTKKLIRDQMAAIKQLQEKVRQLTKLLDDQYGTPCEQIRHQQEVERLRSALEWITEHHDLQAMLTKAREALNHGLPTAEDVRGILNP